jgi:anaerobic selenocysteine-containing dehydrogenase
MAAGLRSPADASLAGRWIEGWGDGLPDFTPERVSEITGVAPERVERLGLEFAEHLPAVAVAGGAALAQSNGLFTALAVNALNALVGSVGVEGGVVFTPRTYATATTRTSDMREFAESLLGAGSENVDALIVNDTNPVFGTPQAWRVEEALSRIGFIVSFGSFLDETGALADLILPDHSPLESWLDHVPESGTADEVWTITPPVMRPLHDTRAMPDVVLELARTVSDPVEGLAEWESFEGVLEAASTDLPASWIRTQERGGWWEPSGSVVPVPGPTPTPVPYTEPSFDGDPDEFPFHLAPYASQAFYDGSLAHLPWLQELPDVLTSAMWSNWVEINPRTGEELGIRDGDMVEVVSAHGSILAPALIYPGIAPDTLGMPVGQGHVRFTRYASGRGSNPLAILAPMVEEATGALAWAATRVRIVRTGGEGNLILFGGALREHDEETR